MKKGIVATAILALVIGCMVVFLSMQLCNWMPFLKTACWVQEQVGGPGEVLLLHHGQINTWHERVEDEEHYSFHTLGDVSKEYEPVHNELQECELGKTAAFALGNGKTPASLVSLESIALNAYCLEVRKAAVHAIESIGSVEAREALIRILIETTE